MHFPFFENHKQKRVKKIIEIFGVEWFRNKEILELGACHGDIGFEFEKLGANVLYCDARIENLQEVKTRNQNSNIHILNQNKPYNLQRKFDLILHLGTLWHIENWYNDLYYALLHSNQMILETTVLPKRGNYSITTPGIDHQYCAYQSKESFFTDSSVEERLQELGCTYTRYDDEILNTNFELSDDDTFVKYIYNWSNQIPAIHQNQRIFHRRFWLINKV